MGITVHVLKANHGDCILITYEKLTEVYNILIDGGPSQTFRYGLRQRYAGSLCNALDTLKEKNQYIDLAILTHVDDDHINGLIKAFEKPGYLSEMVKAIWFNSSKLITSYFNVPEIIDNNLTLNNGSPQTSIKQGIELEDLLESINCERAPLILAGGTHKAGPFALTVLSPEQKQLKQLLHKWPTETVTKETTSHSTDYDLSLDEIWAKDIFKQDSSIYNASSIAFILEADGKKMLFLGDAHDQVVTQNIIRLGFNAKKKLDLDLVKVSHHGSQYNTSNDFLSLINTPYYIISTDGTKHGLPNKRVIARILKETNSKILFNYEHVIAPLLSNNEIESYSSRLEVLDDELRF